MKLTNFKKLSLFLLIIFVSCNPCENGNGDNKDKNYIFYQTESLSKNLIFRFDFENFLIREASENLSLGESHFKDKTIAFNNDSVFIFNNYSLKSSLVLDNVPGVNIRNSFLNNLGDIFIVRTLENEIYKSDLSSNLQFLKNNLLDYSCSLFENNIYFWTAGNSFRLNSIDINNSNESSIDLNLKRSNISDLSVNEENVVFSNYDNNTSKIYILSKNLQILDTNKIIARGNTKIVLIDKDIFYFDKTKIYSDNEEVLYESIDEEEILNIEFDKKMNLVFLYLNNIITNEKSIYYSKYKDNQNIEDFILLINNAEKAD